MWTQLVQSYSYLHGIWQYRWMALVITCFVALSGWAVVYVLPNQYTSQTVVHIDTRSVMTPLLEGLSVESEVDVGINLLSRILLSRKNLVEVIRQTDLGLEADDPEVMGGLVYDLGAAIVLEQIEQRGRRGGSDIYELSYQGSSPELAYQVVSKLLNTLIEDTQESVRTDTAGAQEFLDRQIKEHEVRLIEAEHELAEFKRNNVGFMPDEKGGYYARLQREEDDLANLKAELRLAERKYSAMLKQLEGEAPLLAGIDHGGAKILKLRRYREQLEILLTQYKEQHPDVKAVRAIIAEIIADDNTSEGEFIDTGAGDAVEFNPVYQELKAEIHKASIEVETLKIKLMDQKNSVKALKQAVDVLPGVEARLVKLNRDYEITRERYLSFVDRRESARLTQAVGKAGSNIKFRIIEAPRVPKMASGPDRLLFLSGVFLAAVAVGLGWGFFKYRMQPTFITSNQLREQIGLPVLGSVGLYLTPWHRRKRYLQLTSFLIVFFMLVSIYGAAMVYSDSATELVDDFIASWGLMI